MTIEAMIGILQAYKEGKKIEFRPKGSDTWIEESEPAWNFGNYVYRIKPEPHYRPFKNAEEAMEAIKEHGSWVRLGKSDTYQHIVTFADSLIRLGVTVVSYELAFDDYVFIDGTPFGVKED